MSREHALQSSPSSAEQAHGRLDGPRRLDQLVGQDRRREWLTMAQLAEHGKFMTRDGRHFSAEAARKFVTRHRDLPRGYRGRQIVIDRAVYDRYLVVSAEQRKRA